MFYARVAYHQRIRIIAGYHGNAMVHNVVTCGEAQATYKSIHQHPKAEV
jgi:hypothetical protein